ncbi:MULTISPECIES: hypothetical protein [unclassified Actinomadura]|uniref:hypothetical protein n=1 Tax=unclassified Actinomadura TaxID=2626254 RepID=UPI0013590ADA|nr:hypothetical protein [Actinomadura sp. K4S16]
MTALIGSWLPYASSAGDDAKSVYERLRGLAVRFTQESTAVPESRPCSTTPAAT